MRRLTNSVHAHVTPEAKEGWQMFARSHGVTVSALVEALGLELGSWDVEDGDLPAVLQRAVVSARAVMNARFER